jgi:hypothetical protein
MAGRAGPHGDPGRRRGEELVGEVDVVLKGGDGGAGELHRITVKLLEVTGWLEKGRSELTMVRWLAAEGERGGDPVVEGERKRKRGMFLSSHTLMTSLTVQILQLGELIRSIVMTHSMSVVSFLPPCSLICKSSMSMPMLTP